MLKSTKGMRFTRMGWNGKDQYIELQRPDAHSKMTLPYIFIKTVQGDLVPWLASQTDMLADDWEVYSGSILTVKGLAEDNTCGPQSISCGPQTISCNVTLTKEDDQ